MKEIEIIQALYDRLKEVTTNEHVDEDLTLSDIRNYLEKSEEVSKKKEIRDHVLGMIDNSCQHMKNKLNDVMKSGAVNVEGWNPDYRPMLLPRAIVTALLQYVSNQYVSNQFDGRCTSFEKQMKYDIAKIKDVL